MDDVKKIVLAAGTFRDASVEAEQAGARASVHLRRVATPADVERATIEADALIVTNNELSASHIAALAPSVKIIARAGVGLDALDLDAARRRGIAVYHTPDYATAEVATHAAALILALNRRLREADALARAAWLQWDRLKPIAPMEELTLGLLGFGRIGAAVAERLRPFVLRIQAFDPAVQEFPAYVHAADFEDVLQSSDIISLHLPLTSETASLIGNDELAKMRHGAMLVNVSRGGLVDEDALANALTAEKLAAAALDVLAEEPLRADSPLLSAPRVLLTPHVAWYSDSSERRVREMAVDGVIAYLNGEPPSSGRVVIEAR